MSPNSTRQDHLRSYLPFPLEMEECVCAVCSSSAAEILLTHDSFGYPTRTVQCSQCGLVYVNRRPTWDFMQKFYAKYYWFYAEGFRKFSEEFIRKKKWREHAESRLARYAKYVQDGCRILDVGCGAGLFLDQVRQKYSSVSAMGIEPDSSMADYCRDKLGIQVHEGFFDTFPPSGSFDVIVAFHVIEHLFDFSEFFAFLHKNLREGGVVIIETPNVAGAWQGIGMFHLSHLCTFSPRTISNLFSLHGFEILNAEGLENDLDHSNLYLTARKARSRESAPLSRDEAESRRIAVKCHAIRSIRAVRMLRNWSKMAYFLLCA